MRSAKRTKIALDENRMSILGVQILFGFQLQAPFQSTFDTLAPELRYASLVAFGLLSAAVACLITPSAYHRIASGGGATRRLEGEITWLVNIALMLLAAAIGLDLYLVGEHVLGWPAGLIFGSAFGACALTFWFGVELVQRARAPQMIRRGGNAPDHDDTLEDRIDFVLTEARVVLPGVQALLGFQLIVVLSEAFAALPKSWAIVHLAALASVAISAVFLLAPAAHHRIVFGGEDSEAFPPIASAYLLAGTVFLALGMAADAYVIVAKVLQSPGWGIAAGTGVGAVCLALWHAWPLAARAKRQSAAGRKPAPSR
jgi:Family of unknown function (DUF6328)